MRTTLRFHHRIPFILTLLALLITGSTAHAARVQTDQRCFAETYQCIAGPIRAY
jgi:hypothetical protein